jgi:hypothetical protein
LNEDAGQVVRGDVVSSGNEDKASEVAHSIHEIGLAAIIGDITGSPKIDVKDVERAAKWPGKDELTVAGDSAIGGDAVRALKDPIGDVFAAVGPKESEADAVQGFVDTHVASRGRCVVSGEDVATKRQWNYDKHQHFLVVLDGLKDNKLAIEKGQPVLADVIAVRRVDSGDIGWGEGNGGGQSVEQKLGVGVLLIS